MMTDYRLGPVGNVLRTDGAEMNAAEYADWIASGNTPKPFVPASITPRQARLVLLGAGLLDQVDEIIAGADRATRITWNDASEIRRDFPLIASLGSALGLTSEQIDAMFINASQL